jgi:hypothetical protein
MKLGELSARYESARAGVEAIGWDSRGLASYGTYQIASGVGTMAAFLAWCAKDYPEIPAALDPHRGDMTSRQGPVTGPDGSGLSNFAAAWLSLARGPHRSRLQEAEHGFIQSTHYDVALGLLAVSVANRVRSVEALSQVLWSSAVQHGPAGAARVFGTSAQACNLDAPETTPADFIRAIYAARALRLSRLTPAERQAVLNRYRDEQAAAIRMLGPVG